MLCKKPYVKGDCTFPCGQCLPCRINRRRLWTHRLMLEAIKHESSSFITLTYSDENLPEGGTLQPRDAQLFLKRLRRAIEPYKLRFYLVGEYGEETFRPHYHAALFGIDNRQIDQISACWQHGMVHAGTLTLESAQYIAGYVTKKMTSPDDERLQGRYPEFARMSNRPGIGHSSLDELEDFLYSDVGARLLMQTKDVPLTLRHGGKQLPLGRYLRDKLRERMGIPKKSVEQNPFIQEQIAEMSALFAASEAGSRISKLATYQKSTRAKIRSIEGKAKIHKKVNKI